MQFGEGCQDSSTRIGKSVADLTSIGLGTTGQLDTGSTEHLQHATHFGGGERRTESSQLAGDRQTASTATLSIELL